MDKKQINLFLDDERIPINCVGYVWQWMKSTSMYSHMEWVIVRDYDQFVDYITENGLPMLVSFDHDLAYEHYEHGAESFYEEFDYSKEFKEKTGMHCAKWLIDYCLNNKLKLPDYLVHSMNTVGRANIQKLLDNFKEYQNKK